MTFKLLLAILFIFYLIGSSLSDNSANTNNNVEKLIKEIFIIPTSEVEAETIQYPIQVNTNTKKRSTAAEDVCTL